MKKLRAVFISVLVAVLGLTGCSKGPTKEELMAQVDYLTQDVAWLEDELEKTTTSLDSSKAELERIQGILMEPDRVVITELIDGTGRTSFMLGDDSELFFPRELYIVGSRAIPNTSRIILADTVSIAPSGSWITGINGTEVQYSHPNGLRGTTKIGSTEVNATYDDLKESLDIFFGEFATSEIVYTDMFLSGTQRGIHARAVTFVEEEPHIVHAFVLSYGRVNLIGAFDFAESNIREELMLQLISSIAWGSEYVRVEG